RPLPAERRTRPGRHGRGVAGLGRRPGAGGRGQGGAAAALAPRRAARRDPAAGAARGPGGGTDRPPGGGHRARRLRPRGTPWVVMELLRGRSLEELLRAEGPLPPVRAARVARGLLEGLHEAGVVHRDIKPGNVMVLGGDRVVITDFGIATVEGGTAITRTGTLIGSPEYMPPERLESGDTTPAGDLWSAGATLQTA